MNELPLLPSGGYDRVASRLRGHRSSPPGFRTHLLGQKSVDCLIFIALNHHGDDGPFFRFSTIQERWDALCAKWGDKVVCAKLVQLDRRGYIDYGTSVRSGWLTPKGIEKLSEFAESESAFS